ncbi:hypothetical protein IAI53_15830 [Thauera sp. CAU 1555]|uniref:Uncharacterized protein n=1 Tax=Thauera sedimentorum TaxID=2767595 RepID=A0ABR9BDD0_9RHOO|nr:hypothetical protein [Thauera sedimentorum]MBC9073442.1 hypothetical protein [Thauera sedimentorum]MBD8504361.1 hypothetical protein [Thauera sedimentorum]
MQSLDGFVSEFSQVLKADRRVYEITKNEPGCYRLAAEKEGGGFSEKRPGEVRI